MVIKDPLIGDPLHAVVGHCSALNLTPRSIGEMAHTVQQHTA